MNKEEALIRLRDRLNREEISVSQFESEWDDIVSSEDFKS